MSDPTAIPFDAAEGPGYQEPWQAQAFALAMQLSRAGVFSSKEWTAALSDEIRLHPARANESPSAAYYRQVLAALERLIGDKGALSGAEITERAETWRRAYLNTPHGEPVELSNAWCARDPDHAHAHEATREPVAVSRPQE